VKAFRLFTGHRAQATALPADLRKALGTEAEASFYYRDLSAERSATPPSSGGCSHSPAGLCSAIDA
jgi:hypothetical protein